MTEAKLPPLLAPKLTEASNGTLSVSTIKDPTEAVVPLYAEASAGDQVELMLVIGDKKRNYEKTLASADLGKDIPFAIEKAHFENGLSAGADARLRYRVSKPGQVPAMSEELKVAIVR